MKLPAIAREINFFVAVGVAATATNVLTALAYQHFLHLSALSASVGGYLSSVAISYLGNSLLTFRRPVAHGPQFARFVAISLAGFAINQAIVLICTHRLGWSLAMAEIPVVLIVPATTFALSKFWAFKQPAQAVAG